LAQRSRKRGRTAKPRGPAQDHSGAKSRAAAEPHAAADARPAEESRPAAAPSQPTAGRRRRAPRTSVQWSAPTGEELSRSQRRDAEARARLKPIAEGERPRVIIVSTAVAALVGLANLVAFIAGLKIGGKHPAASGIVVFSTLMLACAIGLWRLWYGAVLGFMALLAIIVTIFALLLIEASNVLGLIVALLVIAGAGYLFFKLVRVLSRIQMPRYPGPPPAS
jgi:hypothetical protein